MKNFQKFIFAMMAAGFLWANFSHAEAAGGRRESTAEQILETRLKDLAELTQKVVDSNRWLTSEKIRLEKESLEAQADLKLLPQEKEKLSEEMTSLDKRLKELKNQLKEIEMSQPQLERDLQVYKHQESELEEKIKNIEEDIKIFQKNNVLLKK